MKAGPPKVLRCAIYTRKSTEHNLDLAFNSLDAQREACEAYIKSQAHEGWRLIPDRFDDGAFSGASLGRPALQALLDLVRVRTVDVIVVYKVDRLTRSLADFAKLVELFDANNASFVSVTQNFNTTSSMGRLTLNVLLSFAQFEREVIGERVRDKIAASKRKGLWVGGPIPLGYASVDKKLVIVPEEAETVRLIFKLYLKFGSLKRLAEELNRRGLRTKRQLLSNRRVRGGGRFLVGPLRHLLRNRFYIWEIVYRGDIHLGEHEPIVDRVLFEAVQAKLKQGAVARQIWRSRSPAILSGKLFDDRGNRMSPSHANKRGVRYRYYVSQALLQGRRGEVGSVSRASAPDVEQIVLNGLREHLAGLGPAKEAAATDDRQLIECRVERVTIRKKTIEVVMRGEEAEWAAKGTEDEGTDDHRPSHLDSVTLDLPWSVAVSIAAKGILHEPKARGQMTPAARDTLLIAIGKARGWIDDLVTGKATSFAEIAEREGKVERHIRFLAPLAFVAPPVVAAISVGAVPNELTVSSLAKALSWSWTHQGKRFGTKRLA
jgi:DNA invertase Pin-like site-specific DNA recombinase